MAAGADSVVTLARAGCNEVEIYSITGHKLSQVRAILTAEAHGRWTISSRNERRETAAGGCPHWLPTPCVRMRSV